MKKGTGSARPFFFLAEDHETANSLDLGHQFLSNAIFVQLGA
jgi:hypothetical protein